MDEKGGQKSPQSKKNGEDKDMKGRKRSAEEKRCDILEQTYEAKEGQRDSWDTAIEQNNVEEIL